MIKLIFDASNVLFRVASIVEKKSGENGGFGSEEEKSAFALHTGLNSILKFYKKYKPDEIALAFEGAHNWRKKYTADHKDEIAKMYKANRIPTDKSQSFFTLVNDFKELIKLHTSIICLAVEGLEGDDVIAGYVQESAQNLEDTIIIVSGDKDFLQLGKFKNVVLIDPATGKDRIKTEVDFNADYFMFQKCIRGDAGDNVMSAFPRVRKTRLDKAFTDDYEMTQLMKEQWLSPEEDESGNPLIDSSGEIIKRVNNVGVLFEHNRILMDLSAQPDDVKESIKIGISEARANVGRFNHFHFMRFLGKHKLEVIAENADRYVELLSTHIVKNKIVASNVSNPDAIKVTADTVSASEYLKKPKTEVNLFEY